MTRAPVEITHYDIKLKEVAIKTPYQREMEIYKILGVMKELLGPESSKIARDEYIKKGFL